MMMWALIAIPGTCWLCALLAMPRKPASGTEVEELVYRRLLGRYERVILLALAVSFAAFIVLIVALPQHAQRSKTAGESSHQLCTDSLTARLTCFTQQSDGSWAVDILEPSGGWIQEATVSRLPPIGELTSDYSG